MTKQKLLLLLLFFIATTSVLKAQTTWIRELPVDGAVQSMIQTSDGGYALLSRTSYDESLYNDIIKYTSDGQLEWFKTIVLKNNTGYDLFDFIQTSDEGYLLVGRSYISPSHGECLIIKTNAFGDTVFTKSIYYDGGPTHNNTFVKAVEYTPGDYAVLGGKKEGLDNFWFIHRFNTNGDLVQIDYDEPFKPYYDYLFSKIDENRLLIAKRTDTPNYHIKDFEYNTLVEHNYSYFTELHKDNQDGFFRLSKTSLPSQSGNYNLPEIYDEYLIKYNENLDSLWSFNIDSYLENGVEYQKFTGMTATSDGGYAFCGYAGNMFFDAVLFIKTDEYGNIVHWYGYDGEPWYPFETVTGLFETLDGGFVMFVGTDLHNGDLYLIKANPDGTLNTDDNEQYDFTISLYPNPCSDLLNIRFAEDFSGILKITNNIGQNCIVRDINMQTIETIDISNLASGIYFCNFYNNSGNIIFNKKLIKK